MIDLLETARRAIEAVAARAVDLVPDGARIGLGTGRAAEAFIDLLGERRRAGLRVWGVPTSTASAAAARRAEIPLIELGEGGPLDLTVDGADEVAPNLDLVKGWGGALVRERIVATASGTRVILVGEEKLVRGLGQGRRIPVEIIPQAEWLVVRELQRLDLAPVVRRDASGAGPYQTDNGNRIIDCAPPLPLADGREARHLERVLRAIVGVVDTGLFLGTADCVLVGHRDGQVSEMRGRH